jgi:hypothetical protein
MWPIRISELGKLRKIQMQENEKFKAVDEFSHQRSQQALSFECIQTPLREAQS